MITATKVLTHNGKDILIYTLENAKGNIVTMTNYGATVMDIIVPDKHGKAADVNLGFKTVDEYIPSIPFFGASVGRYANRIANGRFTLNGKEYTLACNENPFSHLHGGNAGFDKAVWDATIKGDTLTFVYVSADGEEGYPGELTVNAIVSWSDRDELAITYEATTTADTIVNLANHSYFNLGGAEENILDHELTLQSSRFTPVNAHMIPTGEILPTKGTPLDFSAPHTIGERIGSDHPQIAIGKGYDHNFIIDGQGMRLFGRVYHQKSGRVLEVFSDQPAVQIYSSNFLGDVKGKKDYHSRWGICLETQNYPDAINHDNFPSCVLKAGEKYRRTTIFRFSVKQ
jgi:Galactose mutarotase and related enzymes